MVVTPSPAITFIFSTLLPTTKGWLAEAVPDAVGVPFTVIVAVGSTDFAVNVIEVVELGADRV